MTPAPADAGIGRTPGAARRWGVRAAVALALTALVVVALLVYASFGDRPEQADLDPDAPTPGGSRALAVLLANHGVAVDEVGRASDALREARDGEVTVLVPFSYLLSARSVRALAVLPSSVRVVLVRPDPFALEALGLDVRTDAPYGVTAVLEPGCEVAEAVSAGAAAVGGDRYRIRVEGATLCYDGSLVVLEPLDRPELVLLGARDPLTNEELAEEGNAALALGLLSAHDRVIWLNPTASEPDAETERAGLFDVLPPWVPPALLLLTVAGVLAAFWSGRRLGPPVVEPLPVIVRSAETVEGRSRLYRRARARDRAHEALRAAALSRLLPVLGLGPTPDPRALVAAVADRSGYPVAAVHALLYGPPPVDDRGLVVAATALDALVAAALDPGRAGRTSDGEGSAQ